jgi:putative protein-disulfide isomerase
VKTARLQSREAENHFLVAIRKTLMEGGNNIAKERILLDSAKTISSSVLDYNKFVDDWKHQRGVELFRQDIQKAKYHNIGRYPTLTFIDGTGTGIMITGYRPYSVLKDAFLAMNDRPRGSNSNR